MEQAIGTICMFVMFIVAFVFLCMGDFAQAFFFLGMWGVLKISSALENY